jgi:hypothetical protein
MEQAGRGRDDRPSGIFARLRFVDPAVMRINLLLLMAASFSPFRRD